VLVSRQWGTKDPVSGLLKGQVIKETPQVNEPENTFIPEIGGDQLGDHASEDTTCILQSEL